MISMRTLNPHMKEREHSLRICMHGNLDIYYYITLLYLFYSVILQQSLVHNLAAQQVRASVSLPRLPVAAHEPGAAS